MGVAQMGVPPPSGSGLAQAPRHSHLARLLDADEDDPNEADQRPPDPWLSTY